MQGLQESVCTAKQKKKEISLEVVEQEKLVFEQETELEALTGEKVVQQKASSSRLPQAMVPPTAIEYENISDTESVRSCGSAVVTSSTSISSLATVTITAPPPAVYEAISDCDSTPKGTPRGTPRHLPCHLEQERQPKEVLLTPSFEIEPISDTEVEDGFPSASSTLEMEIEPVSDAEVQPPKLGQNGAKQGFSALDVASADHRRVTMEHSYCSEWGSKSADSAPGTADSSSSKDGEFVSDQLTPGSATVARTPCIEGISPLEEVNLEQEVCFVEMSEEDNDASNVCRRILPYTPKPSKSTTSQATTSQATTSQATNSQATNSQATNSQAKASSTVPRIGNGGVRKRKSSKPRHLSSSMGVENALDVALQGALSPTISKIFAQQPHKKVRTKKRRAPSSGSGSGSTPLQSPVEPLISSVVTMLSMQSVSNIVAMKGQRPSTLSSSRSGSATFVPSPSPPGGAEGEWPETLDATFHTCEEDLMFTLSEEHPPAYLLPWWQPSFKDTSLPVQVLSVSKRAMLTLKQSIKLAKEMEEMETTASLVPSMGEESATGVKGGLETAPKAVVAKVSSKQPAVKTSASSAMLVKGGTKRDALSSSGSEAKKPVARVQVKQSPTACNAEVKRFIYQTLIQACSEVVIPRKTAAAEVKKLTPELKIPEAKIPATNEAKKPTNEAIKPATEAKKLAVEAKKPAVEAKKPAVEAKKSAVEVKKSAVEAKKPGTEAKKPSNEKAGAYVVVPVSTMLLKQMEDIGQLKNRIAAKSAKNLSPIKPPQPTATNSSSGKALVPAGAKNEVSSSQDTIVIEDDVVDTGGCARTLGLRKVKTASHTQTTVLGPSEPDSSTSVVSVKGMIKKILASKDLSVLKPVTGGERVAMLGSAAWELSPFKIMKTIPTLVPPPVELAEGVVKDIVSQPSTLNASAPTVTLTPPPSSGYQPYSSPLLMFSSYRLNPAFLSAGEGPNAVKPSLGSLTYSTKLDPNKVMCKFELTGVCNDPKCTAQHFRDAVMTREEVVADIVSYAPSLAGCGTQEVEGMELDRPQTVGAIADKLSSFSAKFVEKYGKKMTHEMLYKLAIYEANTERAKTKTRKEYVHFEERPWVRGSSVEAGGGAKKLSEKAGAPQGPVGGGLDLLSVSPDLGVPLTAATLSPKIEDERRYCNT